MPQSAPSRSIVSTALATLLFALMATGPVFGQATGYRNHAALLAELRDLRAAHTDLITIEEIARSPGGRAVQAVTVGPRGAAGERPALLFIANASGPHLLGSAVALGLIRRLAEGYGSDTAVTHLLNRVTVFVIPRANPDAAEAFFGRPQWARTGNGTPVDDDKDGVVDEDGPDDLNGDGVITMMRVRDSLGEWIADSVEPRLMRRARAVDGEVGGYRLLVEGVDNDHDEAWNEDGPGGVDVNKNFSYDYEYFAPDAGVNPMSAAETRAIAQFVVDHPNVAAFYVLGPQDNVLEPWKKADPGKGGTSQTGPLRGVLAEDDPWLSAVAKELRELTGRDKGPASASLGGDVLSWGYYHMGRWAFGSRGWWPAETPGSADSSAADSAGAAKRPKGKLPKDDPVKDERAALRWVDRSAPDGFVPWTPVTHPDFPDRTVEVGGFKPFVLVDPPAATLDSVVREQTDAALLVAGRLPRVELRDLEVERVGDRVYRITARVANTGFFPTASRLGERVTWPRRIRVDLGTASGQELASGRAVQLLDPLDGSGGSTELTWIVVGTAGSRVTLKASSPVAGSASQTITLR